MPAKDTAKTASAPKAKSAASPPVVPGPPAGQPPKQRGPASPITIAIVVGLLVSTVFGFWALSHLRGTPGSATRAKCAEEAYHYRSHAQLDDNHAAFLVEKADTDETRTLGLSGRPCMPPQTAMEFTFVTAGKQCFWMKDMLFDIDIVWLDDAGIILHIEPDVRPQDFPKTYCPEVNAQTVIELNAGTAKSFGWTNGKQLLL